MQMTPVRFLLLRVFNLTLGQSAWANAMLRRVLVKILINDSTRSDRYVASSRFFDPRELDQRRP